MKNLKKVISFTLTLLFLFNSLPNPFFDFFGILPVSAEGGTPVADIAYGDFSNTDSLQLNGDSLIKIMPYSLKAAEALERVSLPKTRLHWVTILPLVHILLSRIFHLPHPQTQHAEGSYSLCSLLGIRQLQITFGMKIFRQALVLL